MNLLSHSGIDNLQPRAAKRQAWLAFAAAVRCGILPLAQLQFRSQGWRFNMTWTRSWIIPAVVCAGVMAPQLRAQSPEDSLLRQASAFRPTAPELRWQQIPWELDLKTGMRQAREEKRPIFFWAAGGRGRDGVPLERC
jgi:hypothetical protein